MMASDMIPIGTRVHSKRIGQKAEFDGVITAHFGGRYFVADENGDGWDRNRSEISIITEEEANDA